MHSSNPNDNYQELSASSAPPHSGQPMIGVPIGSANHQSLSVGPWSTGLCDCFDDIPSCCITWWCPCITFGQIAEIVDKGSISCGTSGALHALIYMLTGCGCIYSCFYRSKLRQQYMLDETPCADCCVHCCCEACALCQEYRELKNHGFDMSIGWEGNVEKKRREVAMAPVVDGGMTR